MKLSVVIPAHNEEGCIESTIEALITYLKQEKIQHEILVVNDHSKDDTGKILYRLRNKYNTLWYVSNHNPAGFGFAVRTGLEKFTGDIVAVYMADASDRPEDLVRFYRKAVEGNYDCVFGTRFSSDSQVIDYPWLKLLLNRLANSFIRLLFRHGYNDTTNAFKMYRREVIEGVQPFLSHHFNLTVELPLKAIVRGYSFAVLPNDWINRKTGISKLKISEMGSRYLFIVLYCLIEKWLSCGDYLKKESQTEADEESEAIREKLSS